MFKVVSGDCTLKVAGDPRMGKSLFDGVSKAGLWMTEFFNQTFSKFVESGPKFNFGKLQSLFFVDLFVFPPHPQRMPPSDKFVGYEAHCPHVHCLSIELPSIHLLRRLVDEGSTAFVNALLCLLLDCESKINDFAAFKVRGV